MNLASLLLLSIICSSLSSLSATTSTSKSNEDLLPLHNQQRKIAQNVSLENRRSRISGPWPLKKHHFNNHRSLRTVHGTLNIVGWGFLLPIGAIIAHYFRESTDDWYNLHIMSQLSGFLFGAVGWGIGIFIKNEAKENHMSTHGIIGTIIFAFATLEPNEEHKCHKYWVMYHNFVGYALIFLIIANIFQGISNQNAPRKWDLFYGIVLGALCIIALALEILRWRYA